MFMHVHASVSYRTARKPMSCLSVHYPGWSHTPLSALWSQGKGLFFVNETESSYRLKLFLEQFHVRSAVLNAELPLNSRLHILQVWCVETRTSVTAPKQGTAGPGPGPGPLVGATRELSRYFLLVFGSLFPSC